MRCARCGTPWQRLIRVRHWGCRCLRRRWEGQLAGIGLGLLLEVRLAWTRNEFTNNCIWVLNVNLLPELDQRQVDLSLALTRGWLSLSGCGSNCVLIASLVPSLRCHGRGCQKHLYQCAGFPFLSFLGRKTKASRRTSVKPRKREGCSHQISDDGVTRQPALSRKRNGGQAKAITKSREIKPRLKPARGKAR